MVHHHLLLILSALFVVFLLIMLGQKLRISYPIFLVLGGLGIGFIPGVPRLAFDPEIIFLIFLPPLLYEAAWYTSWNNFWRWRRAIGLLAFGLVICTSLIVAYVSSAMIPGFTLALGFLLGGIISPPDAVAATSVLKDVKVPKRVLTILEGESLINDASSLIVFRFALAAVMSGTFVFKDAATDFFLVTGMGIVIGLVIAHIFYFLHRLLPTTTNIDTALTLMAPYFMYLAAEHFHYSGVMAVVTGGLFLSFRSHEILTHKSRIQAHGVWETLTFILNGLVFILIGLQLPDIMEGLGDYSIAEAVKYALIISGLTILIRMVWIFPAAFIPRWLSKKIRTNEANPGWQGPLIIGWAGMRGVVSLASALSIPLMLDASTPFPQRNLILFITFVVILITLVVQGLTLPFIIRLTGMSEIDETVPTEEQEAAVKLHLMRTALDKLTNHHAEDIQRNELVGNLRRQLENDISLTDQRLESLDCDMSQRVHYNQILTNLIRAQRQELFVLRKENRYGDEVIRKHEAQLDLDEAKISTYIHY